jgi:RNA polymerase sigma factor (sigma-70 family)
MNQISSQRLAEQWYQQYYALVLSRCLQILGDRSRAEDAVQEVFMRLLKTSVDLHSENPVSLLISMAGQVSLNAIRKDRKLKTYDSEEEQTFFEAMLNHEEEPTWTARNFLAKIFQEKSRTNDIALLYFLDGMTTLEISEFLNISLSTVKRDLKVFETYVQPFKKEGL